MRAHAVVVLDAMLSDSLAAQRLVDQAREAGKEVLVTYLYRNPLDAYRSALERAATEGRVPSVEYFLDATRGTAKTAESLKEHYARDPHVGVRVVMNVGPRGDSKISTIESLPSADYTKLRGQLYDLVESEYAAGRVTKAVYEQARRDDNRPEGGLVRGAGSDRPQPGGSKGPSQESPRSREPDSVTASRPQPPFFAITGKITYPPIVWTAGPGRDRARQRYRRCNLRLHFS